MMFERFLEYLSRIAKPIMWFGLLLWAVMFWPLKQLPPIERIVTASQQVPIQKETKRQPFNIIYKDQFISIRPLAEYEISGLVMSHNDPAKWYRFDISNDQFSLNTRDLCMVWGTNTRSDDYKQLDIHNSDYTCVVRPRKFGLDFTIDQLSNNHLITDNEAIRKQIAALHAGDQVQIKGFLASYTEPRWNGWYRSSSLVRTDRGDRACEVVFVESLTVLDSYNKYWAFIQSLGWFMFLGGLLSRVILFILNR